MPVIRRRMFAAFTMICLASVALPAMAQTRVLSTSFGDVEIPANPERIITTHNIATQPLLDLGVVPVGRGTVASTNVLPEVWSQIADIPTIDVGGGELNYEQIVELAPDLIFEINTADEARIERLRQIAPVVLVGIGGADRAQWQNRVRQIADAVDKVEIYEGLEAEFAKRQANIAEQYGAIAKANPLAVWAVWEFGYVSVYPSNTMTGNILVPAGAVYAPGIEAMASDDGEEVEISNEDIGTVLGDAGLVLYATNLDLSPIEDTQQTRELPNYTALKAVAGGTEFPLGKLTIASFGDANATLDNYVAALTQLAQAAN